MKTTIEYIAIVLVVMILIQSSINMLITFRQFAYGIHPNSRLENNPANATSNQLLLRSKNETTSWVDWLQKHWVDFSQAVGGLATAGALVFVGYQSMQSRNQTRLTQKQINQTRQGMCAVCINCNKRFTSMRAVSMHLKVTAARHAVIFSNHGNYDKKTGTNNYAN